MPIGPCSFIAPFNFPLNLAAHKVAPALAVGCPFVLKPASRTPIGALIIGGAHPYERRLPSSSRPDGSDPEAFVGAFFERMGLDRAGLSAEQEAAVLDIAFRASAASQQDRPGLENVLPSMTMPCLLYVGEEDDNFPQVQACVQRIPKVTLVSFPGLNHPEAFYRADLVLPHALKFLQAVSRG